jgi:hypothetical protein
MMPYDTYRLYQIDRAKSPAEARRADERLMVLEAAGHGSFVRPPELCLSVFGRFVTGRP